MEPDGAVGAKKHVFFFWLPWLVSEDVGVLFVPDAVGVLRCDRPHPQRRWCGIGLVRYATKSKVHRY